MKVGLFIPCYVDAFFPEVGIATLELLERLGLRGRLSARPDLLRPADGQQRLPRRRGGTEALFVKNFAGFDHIVTPSGSCAHHVRDHLTAIAQTAAGAEGPAQHLRARRVPARRAQGRRRFRGPSSRTRSACTTAARRCAALREAKASEIDEPSFSKPMRSAVARCKGIEFVTPERPDECCGFGGTFSVFEEPVSAKMGYDKVDDHHSAGAEYIVSADMSCLMHQKGCAERLGLADQVHPHRPGPNGSRSA